MLTVMLVVETPDSNVDPRTLITSQGSDTLTAIVLAEWFYCDHQSALADTLSPLKHCRVTVKILPERQFRLNETSNHFIQGEGGGTGGIRPPAVCMNQHTA